MQEKGWMNEEGIKTCFNKVWLEGLVGYLKKTALFVLITSKPMLHKVQKQSRPENSTCCDTHWANQPTATS